MKKYGFTLFTDRVEFTDERGTQVQPIPFTENQSFVIARELVYSVWWAKQTGHAFFNKTGMSLDQALEVTAASREVGHNV